MGYEDESFWDSYGDYLKESQARHLVMVRYAPRNAITNRLLDLGCGQFASALGMVHPAKYWGLDQFNPGSRLSGDELVANDEFIEMNYREVLPTRVNLTAFVSLFSAEATAPAAVNHALYAKLFKTYTHLEVGLVAGFYYRSQPGEAVVEETGGIKSYQTLPELPESNSVYSEVRALVDAPSKMFGPDVVEVWRYLTRK